MRNRAFVYPLLAFVGAAPATALAGIVVTAAIQTPAGDVPAGSTVQVACFAEGSPSMGAPTSVLKVDVAVSGGAVTPSTLTGAVSQQCNGSTASCSVIQGSVAWGTPVTPETLTATCTATYQGTFGGPRTATSSPATLTTIAANALPPAIAGVTGPAQLIVGKRAAFTVDAADPNLPALPLTYAWSAGAGALEVDPANPAVASWIAPDAPGTYAVTVAVSNGKATSTLTKLVSTVLAEYQAGLDLPVGAPRRLAVDDVGALYLVDGQQGEKGSVLLLTARGEARGFASVPERALAVAHGGGFLWVTTASGSVYRLDAVTGRAAGKLTLAGGALLRPLGIAYEPRTMTLWVAEADRNAVRVLRLDGTTAAVLDSAGGAPLREPVDLAVDAAAGRIYVVVAGARTAAALAAGEPAAAGRVLHAFDTAGAYVDSFVAVGGAAGEISRPGGVAVGGGKIYVSDVYQGVIQVLSPTGAAVATLGAFGAAAGQLTNPTGLARMANGDLAVANASLGRVDRFGDGAALPTCQVAGQLDSDCDGLADDWERAHGFGVAWAGDALLDYDGDGLSNLEEFTVGSDPRSRDTDGDGYSDGDEVLAGYDPLDATDHLPKLAASGPAETPPGLVKLYATASGPQGGTVSWTQVSGPAVTLLDASTASPSFVARVEGLYAFEAVASVGGVASAPARVEVQVTNAPPVADAGRVTVAAPGRQLRLDGLFSSDANGGALAFRWDQTLGPAVSGAQAGSGLAVRPRGAGLYKFMLTVTDPRGASSSVEVPVLITAAPVSTAIAAVPADGRVGESVVLDASASILTDPEATFAWEVVEAPAPVALSGATAAVASFTPSAAGRYVLEVTVGTSRLRSPPARAEVFVANAGGALPTIASATSAASVVAVGAPVALDAIGSGTAYRWAQVAGPAAGLTGADAGTATAVPFSPGFHVFEVSAVDGAAVGRPVRVAFEARAAGAPIPQARAAIATGATAIEGQLVILDGRASTGAARYRWTQVGGPWTDLGGDGGAVVTFRAAVPGRYAFELEVDDGKVRSAPARVEVEVVAAQGGLR